MYVYTTFLRTSNKCHIDLRFFMFMAFYYAACCFSSFTHAEYKWKSSPAAAAVVVLVHFLFYLFSFVFIDLFVQESTKVKQLLVGGLKKLPLV